MGVSLLTPSTAYMTQPLFDLSGDNSAQAMKTTPGRLHGLHVINPTVAAAYIQLFDLATGSVTVGTTVPIQSFFIAASGALSKDFPEPLIFGTAITYACTTTVNGNGNPASALNVSAVYS